MDRSKTRRLGFFWVIVIGISVLPISVARAADNLKISWYIINFDTSTSPPTLRPGGQASATTTDGTIITMKGSGTFSSNSGKPQNVTGGGTWETFDALGNHTGNGTYKVTRFVSFALVPDVTPFDLTNATCTDCQVHASLAVLGIEYSDGSEGVLVLSCLASMGTPPSVFEGITATKDFVDYWKPGPGDSATAINILQ
jgi:hypothetical protein